MSGRTFRYAGRSSVIGVMLMGMMGGSAQAADVNRDGLPDAWERAHGLSLSYDQRFADQDRDGLNNLYEFRSSTDPKRVDSDRDGRGDGREDADGDRLTNAQEQRLRTRSNDPDSDDDGRPDYVEDNDSDRLGNGLELAIGTNPVDADTDNDGVTDADEDSDGDNLENDEEFLSGTKPADSDSDDDGILDGNEDRDGDGVDNDDEFALGTDPRDSDSDDDGVQDGAESAGTIVSFDGTTLVITQLDGSTLSAPVAASIVVEADDCDTFRDNDGEGTLADLQPGVVLSEVEIDEQTQEIVEVEIAVDSDLAEDDD